MFASSLVKKYEKFYYYIKINFYLVFSVISNVPNLAAKAVSLIISDDDNSSTLEFQDQKDKLVNTMSTQNCQMSSL